MQMQMKLHEKLVDCKLGSLGSNAHCYKPSEASASGTKLPAAPKMPSVGPRPIINMTRATCLQANQHVSLTHVFLT